MQQQTANKKTTIKKKKMEWNDVNKNERSKSYTKIANAKTLKQPERERDKENERMK